MTKEIPVTLTIAGSDSGGGAGIQADLKTFAANNTFGISVITCITSQTPDSVAHIQPTDTNTIKSQLDQLRTFFNIKAIKTGMLYCRKTIELVADFATKANNTPLVVDPVMISSSGNSLISEDAITAYKEYLFPVATIITPNTDEAATICEITKINHANQAKTAELISQNYKCSVLIKGGHIKGDQLTDILAHHGSTTSTLTCSRIHNIDTHGSGCTLSSGIASQLAIGKNIEDAVSLAHRYLQRCMSNPITLNTTHYINHFPEK